MMRVNKNTSGRELKWKGEEGSLNSSFGGIVRPFVYHSPSSLVLDYFLLDYTEHAISILVSERHRIKLSPTLRERHATNLLGHHPLKRNRKPILPRRAPISLQQLPNRAFYDPLSRPLEHEPALPSWHNQYVYVSLNFWDTHSLNHLHRSSDTSSFESWSTDSPKLVAAYYPQPSRIQRAKRSPPIRMLELLEQAFALPAGSVIQIPGEEASLLWIITAILLLPVTLFIYLECILNWISLLDLAFSYSRESCIFTTFAVFALFQLLYHSDALNFGSLEMGLIMVFDMFDFFDIFEI
ncbi:hypothetical protein BJY00DRAFT_315754 [Aspergillus carlsbadensis]|nr:hypothetical protein BJY00DRAFT_315754 [Aspergillus carlsbadensis]